MTQLRWIERNGEKVLQQYIEIISWMCSDEDPDNILKRIPIPSHEWQDVPTVKEELIHENIYY